MKKHVQKVISLSVGILAGVVVLVSTALLIGDYVDARQRAPLDEQRVLALQEEVQIDAGVAAELAAEQDRQTVASLERKARNTRRGWLLAVTAVVMVACLKWFTSLRGQAAPQLAKLIALRASMLTATAMAPATSEQRADRAEEPDPDFVDALVAREGCSPEAAIPILRAIQDHHGYLPDEALRRVCELTEITPAQIAGTSSFYANFRRSPVGRHVVRVCHGTACHVAGARQVTNELRRHLKIPSDGDTDPEGMFTVDQVACLGCCSLAPVMMIDEHVVGKLTPTSACTALAALREEVEA